MATNHNSVDTTITKEYILQWIHSVTTMRGNYKKLLSFVNHNNLVLKGYGELNSTIKMFLRKCLRDEINTCNDVQLKFANQIKELEKTETIIQQSLNEK